MFCLHKQDITEARMNELRLLGEKRNDSKDNRLKAKKAFYLGRPTGSEKSKKISLLHSEFRG